MIFTETNIPGVTIVDIVKMEDDRGFFARSYCRDEFKENGIDFSPVQTNVSYNKVYGTLRGMHYQKSPHEEAKLVRCSKGTIFDVAVDLRKNSPTFRKWIGLELNDKNGRALFIPKGCAHGFLTRSDDTEITYLMGQSYVEDSGTGFRWNDPEFSIIWPDQPVIISDRDASFPKIS
jgi:dTDP-4-dehydrorhamnose 3,5-epimerase